MADDLNTRIRMTVRSSNLLQRAVDTTLSIEGQAADAAAVGAALAQKADVSQVTGISVNGQAADQQGKILIDGSDIPVSGEDATTLDEAIGDLQGRTAEDIPMSDESGAMSVAEAINTGVARNADAIPLEAGSETMVKDAIDALDTDVEAIKAWTADDIPMDSTQGAESVKGVVEGLEDDVEELQGQTAADIPLNAEPGAESVGAAVEDLQEGRVKTVNGQAADAEGEITLETVPFAEDLKTEDSVLSDMAFIVRTAGGQASIKTGDATLRKLTGQMVKTGYVPEELDISVQAEDRGEGEDPITADIDRDTWVAQAEESGTTVFVYSNGAWKLSGETVDLAEYGITVNGTAIAGDQITVKYVMEERGTVAQADPDALTATGWNLYNNDLGYARVAAYGGKYKVGGSYATIRFAKTPGGTSSAIVTDANGLFDITEDGYVLLTGGNGTDTYILCCWTDWEGGYSGDFEAYRESTVELAAIMASLPYGLCRAGDVFDEIDFTSKVITQRIGRVAYTEEARAEAAASGKAWEFDEDWIWIELDEPQTSSFSLTNTYHASEHGIEFFTGTLAPVGTEIAYGASLKDKVRRDMVTLSQQTLTDGQKNQVRENIAAAAADDLAALADKIASLQIRSIQVPLPATFAAGATHHTNLKTLIDADMPEGYKYLGLATFYGGASKIALIAARYDDSDWSFVAVNMAASAVGGKKTTIGYLCIKK